MNPMIVAYAKAAASTFASHAGTLVQLVDRLKAQPDTAAVHMNRALDEIKKTCVAFDDAVNAFAEFVDQPRVATLIRLQGGHLAQDVESGRGHCHVVKQIYDRYLNTWFQRAFGDPNERIMVEHIFTTFEQGDTDLFHWLTMLAVELQAEATALIPLYRAQDHATVHANAWRVLDELAPVQREINNLGAALFKLRNELLDVTAALPASAKA